MMWRVIFQKPVPGKSQPTPDELLRHHRILIVSAASATEAVRKAHVSEFAGPVVGLISATPIEGDVVLYHP